MGLIRSGVARVRCLVVVAPLLALLVACVEVPATPESQTRRVGEQATLTATVLDGNGDPLADRFVVLVVANEPRVYTAQPPFDTGCTDANGQVSFSYTQTLAGVDQVRAWDVTEELGQVFGPVCPGGATALAELEAAYAAGAFDAQIAGAEVAIAEEAATSQVAPAEVVWLPPTSTPGGAVSGRYSRAGVNLVVSANALATGRLHGSLSYRDESVALSNVRVQAVVVDGANGSVYGTAIASTGEGTLPVHFRFDVIDGDRARSTDAYRIVMAPRDSTPWFYSSDWREAPASIAVELARR